LVWGDADIFSHVVLNLLSNASKFSPSEATIALTASAEPPDVTVADTGLGLDETDLSLLFKPESRPSNKPTGSESSSGQGLLLCERWMRAMGGSITSTSTKGKGSTFRVSLRPAKEDKPSTE
jgi:signal transduction histidine kinase